jgi:hypothetical protein
MAQKKVQRDKQRCTKHTHKTKVRVKRTPLIHYNLQKEGIT